MATFLVTGGAGYIGSHICKLLARRGHRPVTYDNLSRGHRGAVRWGPLEEGDLNDAARLREVLHRWRPDGVFHFAALAYVGESTGDPGLYYRNNVVGTLSLLEAMRDAGVERIVFSSTCATYGLPVRPLIEETDPQRPINPYGRSKLMVESMLRDFAAAYGTRPLIVRYFNAAGADPEGEIGERHDPEPHAVPLAIQAARGRIPRFQVLGTDYDTPDGSAVRDYVHVWDLAEAHCAAMERLESGHSGEAVNLGTGVGTSVLELLAAVGRVSGRRVPVAHAARRPGDPPSLVANAGHANAVLGWRPRYRGIDDIVRTAWDWHTGAGDQAVDV
ncbi:UDP-glucose 4-epimerase GalE [Azospirillum sp.]|uniref:UDP-glucose 4-epimerase GalE n=1 Tax=Azospirillum sp. TaxID=34012 RepID=UPI003D74E239